MSVTVANVFSPAVPGSELISIKEVTFDSSYLSEGEPLTASELGLKKVNAAWCQVINGSENESEFPVDTAWYDKAGEKIRLINGKTSKEVASAKNVEKVKALVFAIGTLK